MHLFLEQYGLLVSLAASILILIALTVFGRRRVRFNFLDYGCLYLPFFSWFAGFNAQANKSLANPVAEPVILLGIIAIVLSGRVLLGQVPKGRAVSAVLLTFLIIVGYAIGACFHAFPE